MKHLFILCLVSLFQVISLITVSAQCITCNNTNTYAGTTAGANLVQINGGNNNGIDNSFFGRTTGNRVTTGDANSLFGKDAGRNIISGSHNSIFGSYAGDVNSASQNSFFGAFSGYNNLKGVGNSFFGYEAGRANLGGSNNSFFGHSAGLANNTGANNSFFGTGSGAFNTEGFSNSFFGRFSGRKNTTGDENSFFGHEAGDANTSGSQNVFMGRYAGRFHRTGNRNVFLGTAAGELYNGSRNTLIGFGAGNTTSGSNNIMIGTNAGPSGFVTVNNLLYIHNASTNLPLIYGDFSNQEMIVNGTLEVTGGNSVASSRTKKKGFVNINEAEVLSKISDMDLQEWSYINHPDQRHIGPIAEDFYAAFGLGKDEKTITTTDMSGVALVAIQALEKENNTLKESLKEMTYLINKMNDRLQILEEK